jgi:uncharacterized repeat protein (TIGR01451 family)/fimbrial isopeptide formation D2 family protein
MRSKYGIKSLPQILMGVIFATATTIQIIAPAIAQTVPPALTVTKVINSSSTTPVGYPVTYTMVVTNAAGTSDAQNVTITDLLPLGFTYDSTIGSPNLSGGATRGNNFTNPTSGNRQPAWTKFNIPPTGSVSINFIAKTNPGLVARTYHNSVSVAYENTAAATFTASYNGNSSNAEDVTLTAPVLTAPTVGSPPPPTTNSALVCGKPGSAGVGNLSGVINSYFSPTASSAAAGSTSMALGASGGAGNQIDIGDLLLMIQMQDASINSTNSNLYGSGNSSYLGSGQTDMGASGLYEYVIATSNVLATGGTLTLKGAGSNQGLVNSYTNESANTTRGQRRFQIIRVPQYASVTLTSKLEALPWNGSIGGVVALDIVGQLDFGGWTIDTVNTGFRAGYANVHTSGNSTADYRSLTTSYIGAGKGEGTAGTPRFVWNGITAVDNLVDGYPAGDTGRGAPANAGGGGNLHNAGGGGGGNGGIGGQGGLPWEGQNGPLDAGGRPGFPASIYAAAPWRLMMGGGGGGGDANNATTGVRGGMGGGLAIVRAGTIVGQGTIVANGNNGDRGAYSGAPDGAGGGGAGGTVLIQTRNSSPTAKITIDANGGRGGNTANDNNNEHGPGGGGGGGVVAYNVPNGTIIANVEGGLSGKANDGNGIAHGAVDGLPGQKVPFVSTEDPFTAVNGSSCLPALTVTKGTSTPRVNRHGLAKYKITVTNTASIGSAIDVDIDDPLPTGFTYSSTDSIALSGNATQTTVTTPTANATQPVWGKFTIPAGGKVEINFRAKVGASVTTGTYQNPAQSKYLDPARLNPTGLLTNTYHPATSTAEDVTVNSNAQVLMVKRITAINGLVTNPNDNSTKLDEFVHNTSTVVGVPINDQNCYWHTAIPDSANPNLCQNTYTVGAVNAGPVKPGDTIEYTIYFINAGGADAKNVKICDLLRPHQTYIPGSLQLQLASGTTLDLTDASDSAIDRGQFVAPADPDATKTSHCHLSGTNLNGVVAIDLTGTTGSPTLDIMPSSTSAGQPPLSYGWFRFKTKVNP